MGRLISVNTSSFARINWLLASLWILMILASFQTSADEKNLFHQRPVMPGGFLKGAELDASLKRAIVILEDTPYARIYGLKEDSTLVGNVFHNGKFFIARIPRVVRKTYFVSEPFGGIMAHSMLRFEFFENQQAELIAEVPDLQQAELRQPGKAIEPIFLQDLLLSVEATTKKGKATFSPTKGFLNLNGLVYRIVSLTGRGVGPYLQHKKKVYDTLLNLTEEESNRALQISLRTSHDVGMCEMYNTISKNCNIYVYRILNQARPFFDMDHSVVQNITGAMAALLNEIGIISRVWPSLGKFGLFWRGFVDLSSPSASLLNDHPRFRELAEKYECEKALRNKD